ncbi:MAG: S41 family peptidase [Bacteroidota bacterium]
MKKPLIALCASLALFSACQQTAESPIVDHLKTFAKAYGYVKYFHPSDEASKIDWGVFAAYGADQIRQCQTESEVISTLNTLFQPIAPGIVFSDSPTNYDLSSITPSDLEGYQPTYWQHKGVSKDMFYDYLYKSVRIGRDTEKDEASNFGNMTASVDATPYRGKTIKYSTWVKVNKSARDGAQLWFRVDKLDRSRGFFDNMDGSPIKNQEWAAYEIIGEVDSLAAGITFGCFLNGKGTLYLDDVQLAYQENEEWIEIPLENGDFELDSIRGNTWSTKSKGYAYRLSNIEQKEGQQCAVIEYEGLIKRTKGEALFDEHPSFGELVEKQIGTNIYCQIPLSVYYNDEGTYPQSTQLQTLQNTLDTFDIEDNLAMRLGNVINTYNVFQHFYPYFDVVDVDWETALDKALLRSFKDKTKNEHSITLQKMTAPLKDGHIGVYGGETGRYAPPINWQWIEDQLVITDVFQDSLDMQVGDIVTKIDNIPTNEYFEEINSRISAGTKGWLNYMAQGKSMFGKKDTKITIEVNGQTIELERDGKYTDGVTYNAIQEAYTHQQLDNNIFYLNLDAIEMDTITALMPQLQQADGIICDLRGYPNGNHDLISHFLTEKDTVNNWMRVPKFIYPDQEKLVGYENLGWELEPQAPYLGDKKIVFLVDGSSISYAESYAGFIEGYQLATIVGQPTAGANGNINPYSLPGGLRLSWTGMKVVKHDGSQHHAVGVTPDVYVEKTIEGLKAGKDEFLEKAIDVILDQTARPNKN